MLPHNRLMRLLRDNAQAKAKRPLNTVIAAANGDSGPEATIFVYDVIVSDAFWGGVAAEDFVKAMAEASVVADTIHIRVNSPGGDVFAARAMEAAIRGCPKKTVAHVDGYAASAASYLALSCDEVEIAQGGFFMIHKAWCFTMGNSEDLLATASLLEKIDASLADTYASETGLEKKKCEEMMAAETWISSQEAVDLGFADRIAENAPKAEADAWNLAAYANAPKAQAEPAAEPTPAPEPQTDILQGEPDPCTSGQDVGLNETKAFNEAYFDNLNRRLNSRVRPRR